MDKDHLLKQRMAVGRSAGMGAMMGAGINMQSPEPMADYPQDSAVQGGQTWSPEAYGFNDELRRLVTRARWGMSDRDIITLMNQVISELHEQLELAQKDRG